MAHQDLGLDTVSKPFIRQPIHKVEHRYLIEFSCVPQQHHICRRIRADRQSIRCDWISQNFHLPPVTTRFNFFNWQWFSISFSIERFWVKWLISWRGMKIERKVRKKLWEFPHNFQCSIIGTCLTLAEARKVGRKFGVISDDPTQLDLSLIHIWRCRRYSLCRSRWSPYH